MSEVEKSLRNAIADALLVLEKRHDKGAVERKSSTILLRALGYINYTEFHTYEHK